MKTNDSWLWPNEVNSKMYKPPTPQSQKPVSFLEEGLTLRQERPGIIYQDSPLLISTHNQQMRRNSSVWERLKTDSDKPGFGKGTTAGFGSTKNLGFRTKKKKHPTHINKDWSFPEETLKRKSELKCADYNKAIEGKDVWILPLVGISPTPISTRNTGRIKCKSLRNPLIIGGVVSQPGEFSHMAALGWLTPENEASFLCGGSLISDRWVITAAHCTHGPSGSPKVVRLGARRLGDKTAGKLIGVEEIVRHPSYNPPAIYADLALLKLDQDIKLGSDIRPACLYTEFDTTPLQAWATGWGVTGLGEEQSDELLKARLDVVDNVDCAMKLNRSAAIPRGVVPSMLCAGDLSGDWRSDTCQGDSGGPLQIIHPRHKCLHQIIGITSFGRLCALRNSPGVYTRISHYIDWIEKIVWPNNTG
ncbi:serine protease snake-like isoform X2 [Athalia rosae]|uniref:serine protease snake-like isoform X2 n=1 Tax=Athalia rosae TaxID=37344 RepID=UPI002033781A|nr:serine protease snake-like isoform X2 [Athalia rosae]